MLISNYISKKMTFMLIDSEVIPDTQKDIYIYCLEFLGDIFVYNISLLLLGILSKNTMLSFIYILSFSPTRMLAGGYHASNRIKCSVLSYALFAMTMTASDTLASLFPHTMTFFTLIFCLIMTTILSPVETSHKKIKQKNRIRMHYFCSLYLFFLALLSFIFYIYNHFIYNMCMTLVLIIILSGQIVQILINKGGLVHGSKNRNL